MTTAKPPKLVTDSTDYLANLSASFFVIPSQSPNFVGDRKNRGFFFQ